MTSKIKDHAISGPDLMVDLVFPPKTPHSHDPPHFPNPFKIGDYLPINRTNGTTDSKQINFWFATNSEKVMHRKIQVIYVDQ